MKKDIFICAMAFCLFSNATAQNRFGIQAGINLAHISSSDDEINEEKTAMPSFRLGVTSHVSLTKNWSFQPQLILQGKGTGIAHSDHTDKYRFTSIDLPLAFVRTTSSGFFLGAGPNLGINLNGTVNADEGVQNLDIGGEDGGFKRVDLGLDLRAGLKLKKGLVVSLHYLKGISNISNSTNDTWKNNLLGLSLGYMFGSSK